MRSGEGIRLVCASCSATTSDLGVTRCPGCREGLEVEYPDFDERASRLAWPPDLTLPLSDRYSALLPPRARCVPTLGEAPPSVLRSSFIEAEVGCGAVFLDHEGLNPTGSFKDRGTATALSVLPSEEPPVIGVVSTGNMAASVAAYGARAGLPVVVLASHTVPVQKLRAVAVYAPLLLRVVRDHGRLYFDSLALGRALGIQFLNSDHPLRIEGQKTLAFDVCARIRPREPTVLVVPLSSGGNMLAILKGLRELTRAGLLSRMPRVIGVQPAGCAPIWEAYVRELPRVERVERPATIAGSIRNPYPPSGNRVLDAVRATDAEIVTVTDEQMVDAQRRLAAMDGLWVQPDSAASVAALDRLAAEGAIGSADVVVCVLTGAGHRDADTPPADALAPEEIGFEALADRLEAFVGAANVRRDQPS